MLVRSNSLVAVLAAALLLLGAGACDKRAGRHADVDRNGYAEEADRALVEACVSDPNSDPRCARADTDGDGDLDTDDVAFVESRLGGVFFDPDYPYVAHRVCVDGSGVVYLLDLVQDLMFRWSLPGERALAPVALDPDTLVAAYAPGHDRIYLGQLGGSLDAIDPLLPDIREPFASLSQNPKALVGAGDFLFAMDSSANGRERNHTTFAGDGRLLSQVSGVYVSKDVAFSSALERVYFHRQGYSPDVVLWETIDPLTGAIGPVSQTDSDFRIAGPLRPSPDGARFTLGSGNVFEGADLLYDGSLPIEPTDILWLTDGGLLTIRDYPTGGTLIEEWDPELRPRDVRWLPGEPVSVVGWAGHIAVVTVTGDRTTLHPHSLDGDGDGDGVSFTADAFPLDPAASVDTDRDGYPDAWNPGAGPEDSTQGLVLDAFPAHAACQLPEHAPEDQPGVCVIEERIPLYTPRDIAVDAQGIVHLFSSSEPQVFRWSLVTEEHLNPVPVGDADSMLGMNAHGMIYLRYWVTGAITRFDPSEAFPQETHFAAVPRWLYRLAQAGEFLLADTFTLAADGKPLDRYELAGLWASDWDAVGERLFFATNWIPKDVSRIEIDSSSGAFGAFLDSPYHGEFPVEPPVRLSPDRSLVLLGSGYFYDAETLDIVEALPVVPTDTLWLDDGSLLTIRPDGAGATVLEQWAPDRDLAGFAAFPGEPLFLVRWSGRLVAVTLLEGRPAFFPFERMDDADGDGVPVGSDAFPLDPAASQDSDGDGAPDAWNSGAGPEDSTQGLVLDAFPADFPCQLPEHGVGGVCDYYFVLPPNPAEPICEVDTPPATGTEGELVIGSTAEVIPLCDGWFLVAENGVPDGWRVVARNVLDGREGQRFPLPGQPGALALDEAQRILYAALPQENAVAALDLQTGALDQFPLEDAPMDLALDPLGNLFVIDDSRDLHYLPLGGEAFEGDWSIQGRDFLEWNAANDELVAGQSDWSIVGVARYTFDRATGPIRLGWTSGTSSGGGVALSPDGAHIALAVREDSGADRNVTHLDAGDLYPPLGEWIVPPLPRGAAFDPTSTLLAVANETDALVFDVATHALVHTLPVPGPSCTRGVRGVAFSRGGRILVGREHCAPSTIFPTTRFFWRVLP